MIAPNSGDNMVNFGNDWDNILQGEFDKEYYLALRRKLIVEYKTQRIFPGMYDIFNAMKLTSYNDVKCVIIGQDPYHGEGQAHGLSFSVRRGIAPQYWKARRAYEMGGKRSFAVEFRFNGQGESAAQSPRNGLGAVYHGRYQGSE